METDKQLCHITILYMYLHQPLTTSLKKKNSYKRKSDLLLKDERIDVEVKVVCGE